MTLIYHLPLPFIVVSPSGTSPVSEPIVLGYPPLTP